jgi:iron complex outermembrane receptor protein
MAACAASMALTPGAVLAQEGSSVEGEGILEEVLVTGTLIRGVEVTGSQTIGIDSEAVTEKGAISTNELLATVPQVSNFFNQRPEQDPRNSDRQTINRPNLRNLPGVNAASGALTLVLVDGHRITPVGVRQSSVDPDIIPGNAIERVSIVPDGGSSLYGADAVGGVIDFGTISDFDGVQIDLGYDTGDDYSAWRASFLAGTDWQNGSGFISLSTTDREEVLNEDRDWAAKGDWNEEGTVLTPSGAECVEPVGAVTTWFWFGSAWTNNPRAPGAGVTPVGDPCDIEGKSPLIPEQQRDNVYVGITQNFGDAVTLDVKSYFMNRITSYSSYPRGDTISGPSPNELGLTGTFVGELYDSASVGFSYAPNAGYKNLDREIEIETWGITPELTIDLGNTWQSRNTLHYGRSDNSISTPGSNRIKLSEAVEAGLIDPLNIAAADAGLVADILDWETAGESVQELFFIRSIFDGEVMELPAGKLRAAIGVEYAEDRAKQRSGDVTIGGLSAEPYRKADRNLKSIFAELAIPVLETLDLTVSARYDDYSDFGDTTNPNIGFSWFPAEWIKIYGKWGESFNAPTVLDSLGTASGRYVPNAASIVADPNMERTNPSRDDAFLLEGASGSLEPQEADVWAFGFEIEPVTGLMLNASYYEIDFENLLGAPDPQESQAVLLNPDKIVFEPTQGELNAFIANVENADQFDGLSAELIGVIVDRRITNTEEAKLKGIDFGIRYAHDTSFGLMSYGLAGNHQLELDLTQSGSVADQLENETDLYASGHVAWSGNNVRARLTLNYTDGFDASSLAINQTKVDSYLVADLFVGYDFSSASGITEGLSLRLNVDNVFDEDPPEYRRNRNVNYSGFTLGRVFKLGLSKRF